MEMGLGVKRREHNARPRRLAGLCGAALTALAHAAPYAASIIIVLDTSRLGRRLDPRQFALPPPDRRLHRAQLRRHLLQVGFAQHDRGLLAAHVLLELIQLSFAFVEHLLRGGQLRLPGAEPLCAERHFMLGAIQRNADALQSARALPVHSGWRIFARAQNCSGVVTVESKCPHEVTCKHTLQGDPLD